MGPFLNLNRRQKTIAVLLAVAAVFFLLETFTPLKISASLQKIFVPIQFGIYKTKNDVQGFLNTINGIGDLRQENADLEKENALLQAENAKLKKLEAENKVLRDQLGVEKQNQQSILSYVIGQDPILSSSRILLDKGSEDGVKKDAMVFVKDVLIGRIVDVGQYSSTARLLSDPDSKIPSVTSSGVRGLVEGEFGNRVVLTNVAQNQSLEQGETVFTSGESGFPRNMVLGKIDQIEANPADLFKKAQIKPTLDLEKLDVLFIAKEGSE